MTNLTPGSINEMMTATPFVKISIHNSGSKKKSIKFLLLFLIAISGVFIIGRLTSGAALFKDISVITLSAFAEALRDNSIIV
jgi:cytochrome b subunit of formate dehydrogenase